MARKSKMSETIGGYRYKVRQLGATDGLEVLTDLSKLLLPSLGAIIGGGKTAVSSLMNAEVDGAAFGDAAEHIAKNLTTNSVRDIVAKFAEVTDIYGPGFGDQGAPMDAHFEDHFAGRYSELLQWLRFALDLNFGSFLQGLGMGGGTESNHPEPQDQA
jgi:hypothetical protein